MKRSRMYKVLSMVLVITMVGALALATGCGGQKGDAGPGEAPAEILIGRVNPATGPLASFGEGTPFIEEEAIKAVNADGGIYIKEYDKKIPVRIIVADSESSDVKASEAASKMILQDKVNLMITTHTPATVNPVAAAAERNKMPCITMEAPGEAWLEGGPYKWAFHSFWKVDSLIDSFYDAMDTIETNKKIGFALGNDTDGVLFAKVMSEKAAARGYEIVDPGRFPINTKDYTTLISELKKANCDIVYGNMITPDFMTMYKQFHQQGYVPKMLAMSRAILFPADVEAIGGIAEGLMAEVWWSETHPYKSSLTGETPKDLAEKYTKQTSKQPSAAIGYKHANVEIAIDVLKRAQSLDKEAIRQAIAETDLDTIVGHIKFDDQNFSELNVTIGQWQKGDKWPFEMVIINNNKQPEVPVSSKPVIFPLPGTTQK